MSVGPVGPGGGIYPIIDDVVCKVNFQKLIWRPNINGYVVAPLSVGPVGPGGGIYSSTEDVLCRVNFRKMIWRPNNRGYMQFCFCLWALSGPVVGYIQL